MKEWYYNADGDRFGPFSLDELEGKLKETTKVWKQGMAKWEKAALVPELAVYFPNTLPSVPEKDKKLSRETKAFRYIHTGISSTWIFLLLATVEATLQVLDMNDTHVYGLVLFISLMALVWLLIEMKNYLTLLPEVRKPAININWIIVSSIPIYILTAYERGRDIEDTFYSFGLLVVVLAFILNGYHYLRLAQKLTLLKRPGVSKL